MLTSAGVLAASMATAQPARKPEPLVAQKPWIVPIPGATKLQRLEENLGAIDLALTAEDLAEIDAQSAKIAIQGERLPEAALKMTGL